MLSKFNFYDLLGYLLPGATVVLTLYWVGTWALGLTLPPLQTDFGASVFFLGLSYLVGQLVHGLGSIYEEQVNKRDGARLSERLMLDDKDPLALPPKQRLSLVVRDRIMVAASKVFGVTEPRDIFEHSYALIVQKSLAQHPEIFLALNGLARSMLVASGFGVAIGALLFWYQIVLLDAHLFGVSLPSTGLWSLNDQQLQIGLLAIAGFGFTLVLMHRAFHRFRHYFAVSVYYNFLAWYGRQMLTPTVPV